MLMHANDFKGFIKCMRRLVELQTFSLLNSPNILAASMRDTQLDAGNCFSCINVCTTCMYIYIYINIYINPCNIK